jgi:gag-polypeptide of LTR copia-type
MAYHISFKGDLVGRSNYID